MSAKTRSLLSVLVCSAIACQPADRSTPLVEPAAGVTPAAVALEPFEDATTGLWGYTDAAGTAVVAARFELATPFGIGGLAAVVHEGRWTWINRQGDVLPTRPFVFDNGADPWSDDRARFVDDHGKFGFIDPGGAIAIPARFAFVRPFVQQRAAFCEGCRLKPEPGDDHTRVTGGLWGFIDLAGNVVIDPTYTTVGDFEGGTTKVCTTDGGCLELDPNGTVVAAAATP